MSYFAYFQHQEEGTMQISNGVDPVLRITLKDFLTVEPDYVLPIEHHSRFYDQTNGKHWFIRKFDRAAVGSDVPYTDGDKYIANLNSYRYTILPIPEMTLKSEKERVLNELSDYKREMASISTINLFTTFMPIKKVDSSMLLSYRLAGNTPRDFYLKDVYEKNVPLVLSQLELLNNALVEFNRLCDVAFDKTQDEINLLTKIEELESYDIAKNFPPRKFTP